VVHNRIVVRREELVNELEAVLPIVTLTFASALTGVRGDISSRQNLQAVWFSPRFFLSTRLVDPMGTHLDLLPTERPSSARRTQEIIDHVDGGHALVGLEERVFTDDATVVLNNVVRIEVRETHVVLPVVFLEEF